MRPSFASSSSKLTLAFALLFGAPACSGTTNAADASPACASLAACCAKMSGGDQDSCLAVASEGMAQACSGELTVYESSNLCGAGAGSGSERGDGGLRPESGVGPGSASGTASRSGSGSSVGYGSGSVDGGSESGVSSGSSSGSGASSGSSSGSGASSGSGSGSGASSGSSSGSGSGSGTGSGSGSGTADPPGTEVVQGDDLTVYGVTTDGYVAYYDHTASTIDVVSLAGGPPHVVSASPGANFAITAQSGAVLAWTGLDANSVGNLIIWTAADGPKTVSTTSQSGSAAVDSTSRYAVYVTNTSITASDSTCDIVGSLTDGTSQVALVQGVEAAPNQFFAVAGDHAVLNTAVSTATSFTSQVSSYVLGTWAGHVLETSSAGFGYVQGLDAANTEVLVVEPTGTVEVCPLDGSTPAVVTSGDAGAFLSGADYVALLSADGKTVYFAGAGGTTLDSSPVATPSETLLATGTTLGLYALSPTGHTLLATGNASTSLLLGSATSEGALTTLTPLAGFGGAVYTADSSHVLFASNTDATTGIGTLSSFTVASGTHAVVTAGITSLQPFGTGAEAVLSTNATAATVDIESYDAAGTAAPHVIVSNAQPEWVLTSETATRLVYSWNAALGAPAGIYVTALP